MYKMADNTSSGNNFIDENHDDLLNHLSELSEYDQSEWDPDIFKSKLDSFIHDLESHFSHEELILSGAGFSDLRAHALLHRELALNIHKKNLLSYDPKSAAELVREITAETISHELMSDQEYWDLFNDKPSSSKRLLLWSKDLETGHPEIDKQHIALMNHVNHLYLRTQRNNDYQEAAKELRMLVLYSKYHFQEEEKHIDNKVSTQHKANHRKLLDDLNILIEEVESEKYDLSSLADYFDYWLFNHIRTYDVPK